jgi:DNA processing protein
MSQGFAVLTGAALPASLRSLPRPPAALYVRGRLPDDAVPRIAVVGTRTPSPGGREVAYTLGRDLARAGVVVVSGLARGIDAAAHQGAVDGGGITVGFLGSGIDVLYPRTSRILAAEMAAGGAVVSEYPPGVPPLGYQFVQRNRLVAGYTRGTVVVEAGARSGALITAGLALELGREVWAVPGDPLRPSCRGSNRLLRDGAGMVLDGRDLLAALGLLAAGDAPASGARRPPPPSEAERRVLRALEAGAGDAENLARRTGLGAGPLMEALSLLELDRRIVRTGEGFAAAADP